MARTDRTRRRRLDPETRRALIVESATQAFATQPYELVSVVGIADEAGASEALVYRYFGTKADLYAETVRACLAALSERQRSAVAALPAGADPQQHLRAHLDACLDAISSGEPNQAPNLLLPANEPAEALAVRDEDAAESVDFLRGLLPGPADDYFLHGFLGFWTVVCTRWVSRGCLPGERPAMTTAALDAFFGPGVSGRVEPQRRSKFGSRR